MMQGYEEGRPKILRVIAITFTTLTVMLLAVVGYAAMTHAVITVHLGDVAQDVSYKVTLAAGDQIAETAVPTTFTELTETIQGSFVPSGGTQEKTGKAGGTVTLHNETDRVQPLVATTRLLSPDGVLFRLQQAVRVPARGTVDALVLADQDGEAGEIAPTRFTIPGLSTSVQSVIYATSAVPMVRGAASDKVVTATDLEAARKSLLGKARDKVVAASKEAAVPLNNVVQTVLEENTSVKAGDTAKSFTMSLKVTSVVAVFDATEVAKRVAAQGSVPSPVTVTPERYQIVNYDATKREATLTGTATVERAIEKNSSIFRAANFVGMSPQDVKAYLENYHGIVGVDVLVSPYWQKQLPRVPGRIQIDFK